MVRTPTAQYAMIKSPEEGTYHVDLYSTNSEIGNLKAEVAYEVGKDF